MKPLRIIKPDDGFDGVEPENEVGGRVAGVTSIGNELYVIRIPTHGKIQVYDKEQGTPKEPLDITALHLDDNDDPWEQGFTSCTRRNCLYVSDKYKDKVYAVTPHGSNGTQKCEVLSTWVVKPHNGTSAGPSGLSICRDGNVIVTCYEDSTIRIYKPDDDPKGEQPLIFKSMQTKWVIKRPYHAVELSDGRIAVSHYFPDSKKGVSLIRLVPDKLEWEVIQNSMDCMPLIKFGYPRYLTVNSNDYIFVVDQMKSEIIGLHFKGNNVENGTSRVFPVSIEDEAEKVKSMDEPWCIYLDEGAKRIYVGEKTGQRVLVFDTSSMSVNEALE